MLLDRIVALFSRLYVYLHDLFIALPNYVKILFFFILFLSVIGIFISHFLGIYRNIGMWKPKPGSNLMFSYFCGSGQYQRKIAYKEARKLLRSKKLTWISIAGLAYHLGEFSHSSNIFLFICSLLYIPLSIVGFVELLFRIIIGILWLFILNIIHMVLLIGLGLIARVFIPIGKIVDKLSRVKQQCPHCHSVFNLPAFKCSNCGCVHEQLEPGLCGVLFTKCTCGYFLPAALLTGRSELKSICPDPKCCEELAASNVKQFSILLIGGNKSGKTAYIAAFSHQYAKSGAAKKNQAILLEPIYEFAKLEAAYTSGITEPSSDIASVTYNFVHQDKSRSKYNLVVVDIPDEVILSGEYQKNPRNYKYADGLIIMVDPLSIPSIRDECLRDGDINVIENYSEDSLETLVIRFIQDFSDIVGQSANRMIDIPVAVLINKSDIKTIKRKIGMPKIKSTYIADPAKYGDNMARARNDICREYLLDIGGLHNALNNLESVFSDVSYYPVSAIGHIGEADRPFEPFGVIDPIVWIAQKRDKGMYPIMRKFKVLS